MLGATVRGRDFGLKRFFLFWGIVCLVLFAAGCASRSEVSKKPAESFEPGKILVLPFRDMNKIYGKGMSFKCPLCGAVHMVGDVAPGGVDFMTESLFSLLSENKDRELIPPGQGEANRSAILSAGGKELSELELVLAAGERTGADSVLVGSVFRFKQRVGRAYSVETPASVAFDLLLFRVSDGRKLWSGHFDETQQALNENLFKIGTFFKRNAKWLTAEELAAEGLKGVLETFPQ